MNIYATGSTQSKRSLCQMTAFWGIKELGLNRMTSLDIELRLLKMPEGDYGMCTALDDTDRNRNFIIEINKDMNISMVIRTVLHELVHVKQFARNELKPKAIGWRWKTAHVTDATEYLNLPWEKEAYKLEEKLSAKIWKENLI